MFTALLVFAPLMLASQEAAAPAPVHLGPPGILTGRKRGYAATEWEKLDRDVAEGKPVAVQCHAFAPAMFSGRPPRNECVIEVVPPQIDTMAPAIFSGRSPKRGEVIVGARALQYYPASAVGKSQQEAQEIAAAAADPENSNRQVYMPATSVPQQPRRRAPSIFSGRRAPRAQ